VTKYFEEDLKFLEKWLEKPQLTGNFTAMKEPKFVKKINFLF
jgi:hypothetical protein